MTLLAVFTMSFTAVAQITELTNGNVGIGNTNPTEKLDVNGNIRAIRGIFTNNAGFSLMMGQEWLVNRRNVEMQVQNDSNGTFMQNIWTDSTGKTRYLFRSNNTESSLSMSDESGSEIFKIDEGGIANNRVFFHLPKEDMRFIISGWGNDPLLDDYKFVIKSGNAFVQGNIIADNNIGIGTSLFDDGTDTYRLSVNGKIRAEGVKVYTGWADYVFEEDYHLPTLEEVQKYIKKNGHLKDIPSASEVERDGIELGEANKLLLQKIEELTLYLIKQNEELKQHKQQIELLNKKMKANEK